jgi:hypothetical protein
LEVVAARLAALTPVAVLHGGLDRIARREAIGQFTTGRARVLVATDAAAEGLNLHARCRFVVHVDLPWSPTTLAQRAGRVDRIGQTRRVRIWHLAGAGRHEEAVVAALARRFQRIQRDLGGSPLHDWANSLPVPVAAPTSDPDADRIDAGDFAESAADLAQVSNAIRRLRANAASKRRSNQRNPRGVPWLRSRRARTTVGAGVVFLFTGFPRRRGDPRTHVAVHVSLSRVPREPPRTWLHWLMARAAERAIGAVPSADRLRACAEARERDLLARSEIEQRRLRGRWQPSLFDERAARAIDVARDRIDRRTSTHAQRLTELTGAADAPVVEPVFALIVE